MTFNEICQKLGRRFKKYVYYYNNGQRVDVSADSIERVKIFFNAPLIGTIMKGAEVDLKSKITITDDIYIDVKASFGSNSVTKTYGSYYIQEESYSANDKIYTYRMYDEMLKAMVDYQAINITYPCTIQAYFEALVSELGLTTSISLTNGNLTMTSDIYNGINYTYRSVLEDIAIANGILLYIENGDVKVASLDNNTVATINDDILKNSNIDFGEHFGTINTLVLSRAGGSDNIYYPTTLPTNPIEFKISDNQLMNDNNRVNFMPNLFNKLNGISYDIYDTELVGYGGFKPLQKVTFTTGSNTYSSYVFNNEMEWTDSFTESIYTDMPEESVTDYSVSDTTDKRINQAYIIVNKQEQEIKSLAQKIVDVSKTVSGNGSITLENAYNGTLHHLDFYGDISLLFPSTTLYPSTNLYPKGSTLKVNNNYFELDFDFLRYMNATTYDKYVYEDGKQWIERNVGVNQDGSLYKLNKTVIEKRKDIDIIVEKNSTISLVSFSNARLNCVYLTENDYTEIFANKADVTSEINQKANEINLNVTEKLDSVSDNDGIVTSASIILAVNKDTSSETFKADKISLEGKEINLTSDNININSTNFNVDNNGNMTCNNATINGVIEKTTNLGNVKLGGGTTGLLELNGTTDGKNYYSRYNVGGLTLKVDNKNTVNLSGIGGYGRLTLYNNSGNIEWEMDEDGLLFTHGRTSPIIGLYNDGDIFSKGNIEIDKNATINGDLLVVGDKNRIVKIENGDYVKLGAYETTTPYFGDIGSDITDNNGYCKIEIEDIFSQTIENDNYKVFIQKCGDGDLYVKKYDTYFEVHGTPNIEFDWEIKAIQKGYKNKRLEKYIKESEK